MGNAINWFEIPATNFERAVGFYTTILGTPLRVGEFHGVAHAFFPADEAGVAGAIIAGPVVPGGDARVGSSGPIIYLNAGDQIDAIIGRVEAAGGSITAPVTPIPPQGALAIIIDSEGNRVGFHAPPM